MAKTMRNRPLALIPQRPWLAGTVDRPAVARDIPEGGANEQVMEHLQQLVTDTALQRLTDLGLSWDAMDRHMVAALQFKDAVAQQPKIIGLIGGASSGKSTLFNSLVGREVSRVSAHAHETLGAIAATPGDQQEQWTAWLRDESVMPGFDAQSVNGQTAISGSLDAIHVLDHGRPDWPDVVIVDLPDVTSRMSVDEGAVTRTLLPWFDGLVVVVDEERWFDVTVFQEAVAVAGEMGPAVWIVFNCTESGVSVNAEVRERLRLHAEGQAAIDHCVCDFAPGAGFRAMPDEVIARVAGWVQSCDTASRLDRLRHRMRARCKHVWSENVTRADAYQSLRRDVDERLGETVSDTRLSLDLLTSDERGYLGVGHRFLPLYDVVQGIGRQLSKWTGGGRGSGAIDFDKGVDRIADVLRRNLEHRFGEATGRVDRIIAGSDYLGVTGWHPTWSTPTFDERDWAVRIRGHIDAWKKETSKKSRTGDVASVALGMPLLVADLLFLGGAGMTWTWASAWVAGFLGGKALTGMFQKSPAFNEYQTTVKAYQNLIRESLADQCERNLSDMPRRHLPMSDTLSQALMALSGPEPGR